MTGLLCDRKQVNGVYLHSSLSDVKELPAAFVVDVEWKAIANKWLQNQEFTPPLETVVNPL
ncbi:hypothetical protein IQ230_00855 [Gloeocapsopsis crepidinum LEGE 06123]|uniref:Uncharacterized protein n=1 Tax=Gloeocapsopsis crepidinum LEGE 06123 TaxID=588587 RepID=A0ABR9UKX4_9CHRO|nr:hypothetical protein [Gloeocapsopsis crepidinum LEGE 06123]